MYKARNTGGTVSDYQQKKISDKLPISKATEGLWNL